MTNRHDLEAVDRLEQTNHYANGVTVWEPYPVTPHRAAEAAHHLAEAIGGTGLEDPGQRRGPIDAGAIIVLAMLLVVFILALVCMTAIIVVGAS